MASAMSAVCIARIWVRFSRSIAARWLLTSRFDHITSLVIQMPKGLFAHTRSALVIAASISSLSGTTWVTRPVCSASRASKMRPVSRSSCARAAPTSRGSSQLTPMSQPDRPIRTNATLNRADSAAIRMSAPSTTARPPPGGGSVDGRDYGLADRSHVWDQLGDLLLDVQELVDIAHRLAGRYGSISAEIEPSAEAAAGAGDDGDPTVRVGVDFVECLVQADDQVPVHGVELLGPVQRDDRYVWSRVVEQHRVAHGSSLYEQF